MSIELKVKIKSLAAEATIIRREERLAKTVETRASLHQHRVGVVRYEARHSLLAYGYLRGRSYRQIEASCKRSPDWSSVERMIKKYGPPSHNTSFEDWRKPNEQEESMRSAAAGP